MREAALAASLLSHVWHVCVVQEGQALLLAALGHLDSESSKACRVAFIPNPSHEGLQGSLSALTMGIATAVVLPSRRAKIGAFLRLLLQEHAGAGAAGPTTCPHETSCCPHMGTIVIASWPTTGCMLSKTSERCMACLAGVLDAAGTVDLAREAGLNEKALHTGMANTARVKGLMHAARCSLSGTKCYPATTALRVHACSASSSIIHGQFSMLLCSMGLRMCSHAVNGAA